MNKKQKTMITSFRDEENRVKKVNTLFTSKERNYIHRSTNSFMAEDTNTLDEKEKEFLHKINYYTAMKQIKEQFIQEIMQEIQDIESFINAEEKKLQFYQNEIKPNITNTKATNKLIMKHIIKEYFKSSKFKVNTDDLEEIREAGYKNTHEFSIDLQYYLTDNLKSNIEGYNITEKTIKEVPNTLKDEKGDYYDL